MDLQQQLSKTNASKNSIITIGVFDGVHLGHLHLIERLKNTAIQKKYDSGIITFTNHPAEILNPKFKPSFIMNFKQKILALEKTGVDFVVPITFNQTISNMSSLEFIEALQKNLNMKGLVVGPDFAMGKNREATALQLKSLGLEKGFLTEIIEPQKIDGLELRSTAIREFLLSGNVAEASKVLGRNFSLSGTVIHGEKRGRELGFPTANLKNTNDSVVPKNGIYATFAYIDDRKFMSATSIGTNPTFAGDAKTIETYIFNFNKDIYGQAIEVEFIERLRDEIKFTSIESLIVQMNTDMIEVEKILKNQ